MAISQNRIIKGIQVNNCYVKVQSVSGTKNSVQAVVTFSANSEQEPLDSMLEIFTPSMDGGNFIAQAYAHLKTLPEFAGAVDC